MPLLATGVPAPYDYLPLALESLPLALMDVNVTAKLDAVAPYRRLLARVPIFPSPGNHDVSRGGAYARIFAPIPGLGPPLEYGFDSLEVHADAIVAGQKVLIHDDVLATGGTAKATVELVEQLGGEVVGLPFIIELEFLNGRERLEGYDVYSLIKY